jgi:hypothetical protein
MLAMLDSAQDASKFVLRRVIVETLGAIGTEARDALPRLRQMRSDTGPSVKEAVESEAARITCRRA